MKMNFNIDISDFEPFMDDLAKVPAKAMASTFPYYVKTTPIRTGNARRRTIKVGKNKILSNYDYAGALDDGRSSQAKSGMTAPGSDFLAKAIVTEIGRIA